MYICIYITCKHYLFKVQPLRDWFWMQKTDRCNSSLATHYEDSWKDGETAREAVKKRREGVMDNCGQACLSLSSTPTRRVEDLDNLRFFFVFCLRIGVTQGCVSAGLGGWGMENGKGGKRQNYSVQKDISVAFQCGDGVCMHGQRDGGVPSPRLPAVK